VTVWEQICSKLKGTLPQHVYSSLVETAQCREEDPDYLHLSFSDQFSREVFEEKCLPQLQRILAELKRNNCKVTFNVLSPPSPQSHSQLEFDLPREKKNPFSNKYSFDTFVVGSSNQFAHAACQAVSKQPGQCYNPLFIFGGPGLGKTHLIKAIGYEIFESKKTEKIRFVTSESFMNELIHAIRMDRMREFRKKYRDECDVLLLDDVHVMAGKERTQEEFFYTFNYLHECGKQIVVTSDRYPKDIEGLENRLQTRFEWGLVADVQAPDVETRIAILKNKAETEHIVLPDTVAQYVATHITSDIRELEGSLHRLQAYSSLTGVSISLELAQRVMEDIAPRTKHELTPEAVLKLVALHFNVRTTDIKSPKRVRTLSLPRQICMYLLRKHLLMSFPEIGKFMGGKDHTTVLHGVDKISNLQRTDPEILSHINTIEGLIR
jgi:chromosomal replication initiator protein